uniref:Non-specific serine/threonine protein kinase n=1 Tax=Panagrellus redivivus TaxID=6233 RepID=A0A7E4UYM3_PANRE
MLRRVSSSYGQTAGKTYQPIYAKRTLLRRRESDRPISRRLHHHRCTPVPLVTSLDTTTTPISPASNPDEAQLEKSEVAAVPETIVQRVQPETVQPAETPQQLQSTTSSTGPAQPADQHLHSSNSRSGSHQNLHRVPSDLAKSVDANDNNASRFTQQQSSRRGSRNRSLERIGDVPLRTAVEERRSPPSRQPSTDSSASDGPSGAAPVEGTTTGPLLRRGQPTRRPIYHGVGACVPGGRGGLLAKTASASQLRFLGQSQQHLSVPQPARGLPPITQPSVQPRPASPTTECRTRSASPAVLGGAVSGPVPPPPPPTVPPPTEYQSSRDASPPKLHQSRDPGTTPVRPDAVATRPPPLRLERPCLRGSTDSEPRRGSYSRVGVGSSTAATTGGWYTTGTAATLRPPQQQQLSGSPTSSLQPRFRTHLRGATSNEQPSSRVGGTCLQPLSATLAPAVERWLQPYQRHSLGAAPLEHQHQGQQYLSLRHQSHLGHTKPQYSSHAPASTGSTAPLGSKQPTNVRSLRNFYTELQQQRLHAWGAGGGGTSSSATLLTPPRLARLQKVVPSGASSDEKQQPRRLCIEDRYRRFPAPPPPPPERMASMPPPPALGPTKSYCID